MSHVSSWATRHNIFAKCSDSIGILLQSREIFGNKSIIGGCYNFS